jgi:hypothetical protein
VQNLQSAAASGKLAEPQAIWFALWDGARSLSGAQVLRPRPWPLSHRVKQYAGGHWEKIRGVRLEVDSDLVGGPVAHG